jgi:Bacteriophage Mu, Gp36
MITTETLEHAIGGEALAVLTSETPGSDPDQQVITEAIEVALAVVRHYLHHGGYDEVQSLPAIAEDWALALVVERLFARRREMPPGLWAEQANLARHQLMEIANGSRIVPGLTRTEQRILPSGNTTPPLHRQSTLSRL